MKATWTETRIARLTELWHDGVSARLIAADIGVTKGAVVGKAHRLELPKRGSPIDRSGKSPEKKALREEGFRLAAAAKATVQNAATMRTERARVAREERAAQAAQSTTQRWNVSQAQSKAEQDLRRERGQELLPLNMTRQFTRNTGMKFRKCQFIAGEPSADDACKCGAATGESRVYCVDHEVKTRRTRLAWGEAAA